MTLSGGGGEDDTGQQATEDEQKIMGAERVGVLRYGISYVRDRLENRVSGCWQVKGQAFRLLARKQRPPR